MQGSAGRHNAVSRPGLTARCGQLVTIGLVFGALMLALGSTASAGPARGDVSGFEPSIGLTRAQVEARFHEIDRDRTVFKVASPVHGEPRALGEDTHVYALVEITGFPEVVSVEVVLLLDSATKATLEEQVEYGAQSCGLLAAGNAQTWCTARILNTGSRGLVNATTSRTFGAVRVTVKTYQPKEPSSPPVVSIDVSAA